MTSGLQTFERLSALKGGERMIKLALAMVSGMFAVCYFGSIVFGHYLYNLNLFGL
jgi:hypothetical protein